MGPICWKYATKIGGWANFLDFRPTRGKNDQAAAGLGMNFFLTAMSGLAPNVNVGTVEWPYGSTDSLICAIRLSQNWEGLQIHLGGGGREFKYLTHDYTAAAGC